MKTPLKKYGCGRGCTVFPTRLKQQLSNGYTLIELLLVMLCIAILAGRGFSLWQQLSMRVAIRSGMYRLAHSIELARMLAVESGQSYVVCGSRPENKRNTGV